MLLVFQRIGNRRYGILVKRHDLPDVEKSPAPGFDPFIPHDLMHLVVEAKLGIARGVFGQLSAGGDAGTFTLRVRSDESSRDVARLRHRLKERGKKLLREGRDDCLQSERATYICWQAWLARSTSTEQRKIAHTMSEQAQQVRGVADAKENRLLNQTTLIEIFRHLDELSSHWSQLKVGQSMTVRWPDLKVFREDLEP
jgi:hypothetical protein